MDEEHDGVGARAPQGTHDVLAPDSARWEAVIGRFANHVELAGFGLVISPMFEHASVFKRGIGTEAEVVTKEMYEFDDRGGRRLALRPEGTAPIVRAFAQHNPPTPWKAWYVTPAFRYERPQAGRYRQHHQLGVEVLGSDDPDVDVEVIDLLHSFLVSVGLRQLTLTVGSIGDGNCRPAYIDDLRQRLAERADSLCDEHRQRYAINPMRVLDCKDPACIEATHDLPGLLDALCDDCRVHFERVKAGLDAAGIAYQVSDRLVRGLDYYMRTTFEFASRALESAQNAVCGGGRYDTLSEQLGGPAVGGIGFGLGIERLLLTCDAEGVFAVPAPHVDVFVVDVTGGAMARDLSITLRRAGISCDRAFDRRSMKSQLKAADRSGALFALLVGDRELESGTVTVRSLRHGDGENAQESVPRDHIVERMRAHLEGTSL